MTPDEIDDLCFTPATELLAAMRARRLSPVELLEAFLDRIARVNPSLNAYVTLDPDGARAAAIRAEAAYARAKTSGPRDAPDSATGGDLPPLLGLPVSIKDLARTAGLRTTFGSKVFEHHVPDADSPVVRRLREAGAVILGKTNTPEFGWVAITDNAVFGRTNNPWDLARTPSGSSGGAAAATAAGLAPISLGSDGGGSIRHPASFCGIFGIKPTFDLVPRDAEHDGWPTLSHQGPLTRTVADAALALDVMSGHEPGDLYSHPCFAPESRAGGGFLAALEREPDLRNVRVAWTSDMGFARVDARVRAVFERAVPAFAEFCREPREACPDLRDAREIFKGVMYSEAAASGMAHFDAEGRSELTPDLAKFLWKRRDIPARDYLAAQHRRDALAARVARFFEDHDLLITPTMAIPPFPHPPTMRDYPHEVEGVEVTTLGWQPFTFPFNLTHQPAASVPCGLDADGLPVGLQIVGRRHEDALVLAAARAFERARPWADLRLRRFQE